MSLHNVILQELRLLYVPAIQSQLTFIRNLLVMLPKQMEQVRSVVYTNCNGISTGMTKFVLHGLIALLSFHGLIILSPIACLNSLAPISAHHLASWSFRFRHIGIPFPIATSYSSEIALSSGHPLPRTPRYLSGNHTRLFQNFQYKVDSLQKTKHRQRLRLHKLQESAATNALPFDESYRFKFKTIAWYRTGV
jgi:hypothetical protein